MRPAGSDRDSPGELPPRRQRQVGLYRARRRGGTPVKGLVHDTAHSRKPPLSAVLLALADWRTEASGVVEAHFQLLSLHTHSSVFPRRLHRGVRQKRSNGVTFLRLFSRVQGFTSGRAPGAFEGPVDRGRFEGTLQSVARKEGRSDAKIDSELRRWAWGQVRLKTAAWEECGISRTTPEAGGSNR